ncbi:hypothetical protein A0G02_16435 [Pectobacterium peruviense]|uniref:Transposase n=1 Tax=Pectobacterium peruviense TaxID=2066479 RepID=A0ABX4S5A8_9GAMM|nr:hypothetical protein G033_00260 [Pectobacterium peruviense]PKX82110.1 hypothetical protein A0G02_16435 [Pectobacterium peruviense]PKX85722.1 hypothetical protein A0G03_14800 [Pectobacterium peruviense]
MFCKEKISQRDQTHSPQLIINKTLTIIIITTKVNAVIKAAFSSSRGQKATLVRYKKSTKDLLTGLLLITLKTY